MPKILGCLTVDRKGRTTFPQSIRRELGLREGTQLRVELSDYGTFELVPAEVIPQDQLWFHTAEVQARVTRAETDFREGRSTRTAGEKDTLRFLDSLKKRNGGRKRAD